MSLNTIPTEIQNLKNLTELDLSNNYIEKIDAQQFPISSLKILNLKNNPLFQISNFENLILIVLIPQIVISSKIAIVFIQKRNITNYLNYL